MATGKTEVGRRLARLLACPFMDIDGLVEVAAGRTVAEIFANEGEPRFRTLERAAVERACDVPGAGIATGGGTLLDAENRPRPAAARPVVCLTARPEAHPPRGGPALVRDRHRHGPPPRARCSPRLARLSRARRGRHQRANRCALSRTDRRVAAGGGLPPNGGRVPRWRGAQEPRLARGPLRSAPGDRSRATLPRWRGGRRGG